jgi:hypothetical protein
VALSEDQKAMLRLLAQREEGYEDIGALMGLSVAEVRARVRGALAELDSAADNPAPPPPAPVAAPEPEAPPEPPPASEVTAKPPSEREPKARRAEPSRSGPPAILRNRRRLIEIGGGALVALLLVLFATGAIDIGGADSDSKGSDDPAGAAAIPPTSNSRVPTKAVLKGVDGSDAEGEAVFGRLRKQVLLVLGAKGVPPTPKGRSYAISLARSDSERIPIAATKVGENGVISGQFTIPATALGLLASGFDELEVSLVANGALREAVLAAQNAGSTPAFEGIDVLRGPVTGPVVDAG